MLIDLCQYCPVCRPVKCFSKAKTPSLMFKCPFIQAAVSALGYDRLQGWVSRKKLLCCHVLYIWYHQTSWGNDPFLLLPDINFFPAYYLLIKRLSLVQMLFTLIASTPSNFLMYKNIKNSQIDNQNIIAFPRSFPI